MTERLSERSTEYLQGYRDGLEKGYDQARSTLNVYGHTGGGMYDDWKKNSVDYLRESAAKSLLICGIRHEVIIRYIDDREAAVSAYIEALNRELAERDKRNQQRIKRAKLEKEGKK